MKTIFINNLLGIHSEIQLFSFCQPVTQGGGSIPLRQIVTHRTIKIGEPVALNVVSKMLANFYSYINSIQIRKKTAAKGVFKVNFTIFCPLPPRKCYSLVGTAAESNRSSFKLDRIKNGPCGLFLEVVGAALIFMPYFNFYLSTMIVVYTDSKIKADKVTSAQSRRSRSTNDKRCKDN